MRSSSSIIPFSSSSVKSAEILATYLVHVTDKQPNNYNTSPI
jgi:hypothetical protein